MTAETVAIIPARGGSKGIPGKNLALVGGVPLIARAVRTCTQISGIDRVVVTTDDHEISRVAREWGADIVLRPEELASDEASSESALLHAIHELSHRGVEMATIAFVQATSPLLPRRELEAAVSMVRGGTADVAFSARESYEFFWADTADGAWAVGHDAAHRPRRQDREALFVETGAFYVMDAMGFRASGHRFFGRTEIVVVPEQTAIDIDTPADLRLARLVASAFPEEARDAGPIDVDAVITDFDGVHTDDTAIVSETGEEHVRVSRSDGMGVRLLREAGVPILILSTEVNPVVAARANKLGVEVIQALSDKESALRTWARERGIPLERIAYVGNDVNDLGALEAVGWPIAVPDSHPLVAASARSLLTRPGGHGAVRELAERVLAARRPAPLTEGMRP
ncbi:acylneuraminate cytidylyltransferase [Microbacterium amylolyticum]|uniref:N-acylneuraminate cytidylyltransferase n=1 Tax=Microbacterium amylolyticum TaxID=936337 RepID=A0ABS4ZGR9_9MICO|nr:acylneuraminate cytidylyltransferase [Microbacterium amylolyticum]MBP2435676.1 N-acylneuraminate cytidylyltransferase [Microbacterium amylolyticum]